MNKVEDYTISFNSNINQALEKLENGVKSKTLFVINKENKLIGSITDGDIRRALIKGKSPKDKLNGFYNPTPFSLQLEYKIEEIISARKSGILVIPILDDSNKICEVIDFKLQKSKINIEALIMAGGLGTRLRPLTLETPKPLLKIGGREILDYIVSDLIDYGISKIYISVNYLSEKFIEFLDSKEYSIPIELVFEKQQLGTIGALNLIKNKIKSKDLLVTNGDLLTDLDFERFLMLHKTNRAMMSVGCLVVENKIPFAVLDTDNSEIISFKEKPTIQHKVNGGIYLINNKLFNQLPETEAFFNATDLLSKAIQLGKAHTYEHKGEWIDIGTLDQFEKAKARFLTN